jgi:acetyl-CoA carboxylase carboxyl transferase beta subunit
VGKAAQATESLCRLDGCLPQRTRLRRHRQSYQLAVATYLSASEFIVLLVDAGSWVSWDRGLLEPPIVDDEYAADLARARNHTGLDEAVLTGEGTIGGQRAAVAACEFGFLGGSIGVAAAERLVACVERATAERLPLVASPSSGGIRMQEGTVAFVQMAKISAAVARHRAAGLSYLVYLRHPTMGGVLASWASLGHVTIAEPGALIGFLGPRVYRALSGAPLPEGTQRAEELYRHGLVDALVPPDELPATIARMLRVFAAPRRPPTGMADTPGPRWRVADTPAWESIERSRRADRPGVRELLRHAAADVTLLAGAGSGEHNLGEHNPGLLLAVARFGDVSCVVLGHDRQFHQAWRWLGAAALRKARRGMRLAAELGLPLVTVVDTAGAVPAPETEQGGLAAEIARSLRELLVLPVPSVCILLGQGAGGMALALLPTDRVLCAQHAWLSPLPPEGSSELLYQTPSRAMQAAARQGVRSADLVHSGIADRIIPEHPDAADEPGPFLSRLAAALRQELGLLLHAPSADYADRRYRRYRRIGWAESGGTAGSSWPARKRTSS